MKCLRVLPTICYFIILMTLTSCGTSSGPSAGGGIGGTGISQGPITGFGSVFVNGVEFSTTTGTVITQNGNPSTESDLRIGMVVAVHGTFDANGTTGTADQIDFNDELDGPIQSINTGDQTILVMGQTVKVDAGTHYQSAAGLNDLQNGNVIEVSGLPQADGTILATYIELKSTSCSPGSEFEVKGAIRNLNGSTFQINNLTVDYSGAVLENLPSGLGEGVLVEVKTGACYNGGVMIAGTVEGIRSEISGGAGTLVDLEGFVTRFASTADFDVEGQPVSTTGATVYENGTSGNLGLNVRVEVEGKLDANGVLIANKVSF
jgi:hypothetical protein